MGLKFNLASGTDIRDGWINFDIVPRWPLAARGCDVIWDAKRQPIPYACNTADEVYAGYLLLHLPPKYHKQVLMEIQRVLSPSGILTVGEVDMNIVMRRYLDNPLDSRLSELIWGEQGNAHGDAFSEFDKHCQGFTDDSLRHLLIECGFVDLNRITIHCKEVFYELTITCRKK
jgi:hypothetical protein